MKTVFKFFYSLIPFKKQLFTILKFFWQPPESVFKHLHFKGVFAVDAGNGQRFLLKHHGFHIENEIFWQGLEGCWERESMRIWKRLCTEANTILDIGANSGVYALVAKAFNQQSRVFAFEPHPRLYGMLNENISLNHFDIGAINRAVSDSNQPVIIDDYLGNSASFEVQSTTLDAFIREYNLEKVDLIKIDVEMHEPQVLAGFSHFLPLFRPTLIIEILTDEIALKVSQAVSGLGYLYFNIDERGSIRQTERIQKSDYFNYLLCSPETARKAGLI